MNETSEQKLTKQQIYSKEYNKRDYVKEKKREYNARPDIAEKRNILNKTYKDCECGSKYYSSHRKQHNMGKIHKHYLETGEKYIEKNEKS